MADSISESKAVVISIHALREESDRMWSYGLSTTKFQSTLSVRRATDTTAMLSKLVEFQSTLSVRRATSLRRVTADETRISIHALREESDFAHEGFQTVVTFQSTLSVRRATHTCGRPIGFPGISIHALREESDPSTNRRWDAREISIHALREESD